MSVYTVHAPPVDGTDVRGTTDNFVFVRDGFSFWAFVFGPVWLLYQRLWLAFAGYLVLSIAVEVVLTLLRAGGGTRIAVMAVIAVLMGLEAASLRRWTLSRRKWRRARCRCRRRRRGRRATLFRSLDDDAGCGLRSVDRRSRRAATDPERSGPAVLAVMPRSDIVGLFPQPGLPR